MARQPRRIRSTERWLSRTWSKPRRVQKHKHNSNLWLLNEFLGHISRAAQHLAGKSASHLPRFDDRHTIHQHAVHSLGELIRIIECGAIVDGRRIKDHRVGPHASLEYPAIGQTHALRRERGELADGIF